MFSLPEGNEQNRGTYDSPSFTRFTNAYTIFFQPGRLCCAWKSVMTANLGPISVWFWETDKWITIFTLPSGKLTQLWNITIFNGKTHYYEWAIFNSFLYVYQRVSPAWYSWLNPHLWRLFRVKTMVSCRFSHQPIHINPLICHFPQNSQCCDAPNPRAMTRLKNPSYGAGWDCWCPQWVGFARIFCSFCQAWNTTSMEKCTRPGKHTKNYGKPPSLMGKSTINGPCSIAFCMFTRGYESWKHMKTCSWKMGKSWLNPDFQPINI